MEEIKNEFQQMLKAKEELTKQLQQVEIRLIELNAIYNYLNEHEIKEEKEDV